MSQTDDSWILILLNKQDYFSCDKNFFFFLCTENKKEKFVSCANTIEEGIAVSYNREKGTEREWEYGKRI